MSHVERTRDHELDDSVDSGLLAELDEQGKVQVQLQELRSYSREAGVMRLPVSEVTTGKNSETIVIELHHPVQDNPRFYIDKPPYWSTEFHLPQVLSWYGYSASNVYSLQTDRMFVLYNHDSEEWELARPPDLPRTLSEKVSFYGSTACEYAGSVASRLFGIHPPGKPVLTIGLITILTTALMLMYAVFQEWELLLTLGFTIISAVFGFVLGMIIVPPGGN